MSSDSLKAMLETLSDASTASGVYSYVIAGACADAVVEINRLEKHLDASAAGPWIKIEPGCEMPEPGLPVLLAAAGHCIVAWWTGNHWRDHMGPLNGSPTHYAVVRMPEAE